MSLRIVGEVSPGMVDQHDIRVFFKEFDDAAMLLSTIRLMILFRTKGKLT